MVELSNFDKEMLGEVRIRRIAWDKLNPQTARTLREAGLIVKWDNHAGEPAHHGSRRCTWRITDEGLKVLGKERVW